MTRSLPAAGAVHLETRPLSKPIPSDHPICYARPRRLALSAWIQHVPFGLYLIDLLRPASIVELGTRNGISYCAFCQAVQQLEVASSCVAVDSWSGDAHTGSYGPRVLAELHRYHDPLYGGFSRLQQCTFDEAAAGFPDGSIDLLHIDGLHTYEAARHDFETWLPRLSPRAVVLFHDIAEHNRDFGVWHLWEELSARYPSFAFRHGHGLGVLGIGTAIPDAVRALLDLPEPEAQKVRRFFQQRGRRVLTRLVVDLAVGLPTRVFAAAAQFTRKRIPGAAPGG